MVHLQAGWIQQQCTGEASEVDTDKGKRMSTPSILCVDWVSLLLFVVIVCFFFKPGEKFWIPLKSENRPVATEEKRKCVIKGYPFTPLRWRTQAWMPVVFKAANGNHLGKWQGTFLIGSFGGHLYLTPLGCLLKSGSCTQTSYWFLWTQELHFSNILKKIFTLCISSPIYLKSLKIYNSPGSGYKWIWKLELMLDWALFLESTLAEGQPCKENTLVFCLLSTSIPSTQELLVSGLGSLWTMQIIWGHKREACGITHRRVHPDHLMELRPRRSEVYFCVFTTEYAGWAKWWASITWEPSAVSVLSPFLPRPSVQREADLIDLQQDSQQTNSKEQGGETLVTSLCQW